MRTCTPHRNEDFHPQEAAQVTSNEEFVNII